MEVSDWLEMEGLLGSISTIDIDEVNNLVRLACCACMQLHSDIVISLLVLFLCRSFSSSLLFSFSLS